MKKRAVIVSAEGAQDVEVIYPYYRLQEEGYGVDMAAPSIGPFRGINGSKMDATMASGALMEWIKVIQLVILPGGVKAMEKLRLDRDLVQFLREYHRTGGVIGSICSGAQLLVSAGLCKDRNISGYYAMQIDIENAGAKFVDEPFVVSDRIVSSPHYKHLGPWMRAVLEESAKYDLPQMI